MRQTFANRAVITNTLTEQSVEVEADKRNIYNVQNRTRKTLDWGIWLKLY